MLGITPFGASGEGPQSLLMGELYIAALCLSPSYMQDSDAVRLQAFLGCRLQAA